MNRWVAVLVVGMVMLVVGVQGLIRVIVDPGDRGLMSWMPGGTAGPVVGFAVLTILGLALAAIGGRRSR